MNRAIDTLPSRAPRDNTPAEFDVARPQAPNNLPHPVTAFVGRVNDVADIKHRLIGSGRSLLPVRTLTLTGMGGAGKTRLALQVAAEIVAMKGGRMIFPHGVWFVELDQLTEAEYVLPTVAAALGTRESPSQSLLVTILDQLRERRLLLVLDNCEHLRRACADLVVTLHNACPGVQVLATSREALGVPGEMIWAVPPLQSPDLVALEQDQAVKSWVDRVVAYEAVQLFVDRASLSDRGFQLTATNAADVATICARLEGLPLAIELAAARVKALSIAQIVQHLDSALSLLTAGSSIYPRHQTMRATLDWSYSLLSPAEQTVLRRLAILTHSFSLEAAVAIAVDDSGEGHGADQTAQGGIAADDVLEIIIHLVDKSLLVVQRKDGGPVRYKLLEPVRQFGRAKLDASGETLAVSPRLVRFFLTLAKTADPALIGPDQGVWLDQLHVEHDNLRAALQWATDMGDGAAQLQLVGALASFWHAHGHFREGYKALTEVLRHPIQGALEVRAKCLVGAGILAAALSQFAEAAQYQQEALRLYHSVQDQRGIALCLRHLGSLAGNQGNYDLAQQLTRESLTLSRHLSDDHGIAAALNNLGVWARELGDLKAALEAYTESLVYYNRLGHTSQVALALSNMAEALHDLGDVKSATDLLQESLGLYGGLGDTWGMALNYHLIGRVAHRQGDLEGAARAFRDSLIAWRKLGNKRRSLLCLESLAQTLVSQGDAERAVRLLSATKELRQSIGAPLSPAERQDVERTLAAIRADLDLRTFNVAWTLGRTMRLDQAIQYGLETAPRPTADAAPPHLEVLPPVQETARIAPAALMPATQLIAPQTDKPPQLHIFAMGATFVKRGEAILIGPDASLAKPKELLFYLLCHPAATKEQIGLEIWPQATSTQLRGRFHEAIHRLRRVLGDREWIFVSNERYSFNRELGHWFDMEVFDQRLLQLKRLQAGAAHMDQAALTAYREKMQAALSLFRGEFLADLPSSEWVLTRREEFHHKHLEVLQMLGQSYMLSQEYDQASAIYRSVITLDRYYEEAHRKLMVCYAYQGERSQAVRHYHQLVTWLQEEYNSAPDVETTTLYKRLVRGEHLADFA